MKKTDARDWLCLTIGNSRLHWGWFAGGILRETWDSPHFSQPVTDLTPHLQPHIPRALPLYFASVVPQQTQLLSSLISPEPREIVLSDIPITGLYSTIGIDRALAVWGAAQTYGLPVLAIDGGTALTLTGAALYRDSPTLIGGAILPGLRLQFQSLHQKTAALPSVTVSTQLPPRWASNTPNAIESGILYGLLAAIQNFIEDWLQHFPHSTIIFTGGDARVLSELLQQHASELAGRIVVDPHVIFQGARSILERD